jgi:hypothetical protein
MSQAFRAPGPASPHTCRAVDLVGAALCHQVEAKPLLTESPGALFSLTARLAESAEGAVGQVGAASRCP